MNGAGKATRPAPSGIPAKAGIHNPYRPGFLPEHIDIATGTA